jgi:hypothetical protein
VSGTRDLSRALRGRFVRVEIDGGDFPDPHPELVLAQRPSVPELVEAAAVLGAFPDGSYLAGEIRVSLMTL